MDRTFREGIDWLARNTDNAEIGDAIKLLAYLCDTTEEWIWQAVGRRMDAIAEEYDPADEVAKYERAIANNEYADELR